MNKKQMFSLLIDKQLKERLEKEAKTQNRSMSFIISNSLNMYLNWVEKNRLPRDQDNNVINMPTFLGQDTF